MIASTLELSRQAGHWLELERAWSQEGASLSAGAQEFFQRKSEALVLLLMDGHGAEHAPEIPRPTPQEAWEAVEHAVKGRRRLTAASELRALFARGRAVSRVEGGSNAALAAWLGEMELAFARATGERLADEHHEETPWLELVSRWRQWNEHEEMDAFSRLAEIYFCERCAKFAFNYFSEFEHAARTDSLELWRFTLHYLFQKLPDKQVPAMQVVMEESQKRAAKEGLRCEWPHLPGICRQALRPVFGQKVKEMLKSQHGLGRETGTPTQHKRTVSIQAPAGGVDESASDFTVLDALDAEHAHQEQEAGQHRHTQAADFRDFATRWVGDAMTDRSVWKPAYLLRVFLYSLRFRLKVTIDVKNPIVLEAAGLQKAQFANGGREQLRRLIQQLREAERWRDLDTAGRRQIESAVCAAAMDFSQAWFLSEKSMKPLFPLLRKRLQAKFPWRPAPPTPDEAS